MKVKELISILKKFDEDMQVYAKLHDENFYSSICGAQEDEIEFKEDEGCDVLYSEKGVILINEHY